MTIKHKMPIGEWLDEKIIVCSECLRACCWKGIFMCDESREADTVEKTRRQLLPLALEHPDYMVTVDSEASVFVTWEEDE